MAVKSFIPTLIHLLKRVCRYLAKHRDVIVLYLTADQIVLLDAVQTACNAFTDAVTVETEEP